MNVVRPQPVCSRTGFPIHRRSHIPPNENERIGLASIGEILDRVEINRANSLKEACQRLRDVKPRLQELNVDRVVIAYDGYGDSGCVESIAAFNGETQIELPPDLNYALNEAAYGVLPGGWEINCGSLGELIIDLKLRTITREHNWRVEDTEYEEREIMF